MRVLIVEDEEAIQGILASFLKRYGQERSEEVSVKAMFDPVQALFELTSSGDSYDLVLLDVRLPKLTGDEIYNSLIQVAPGVLSRILFVTGYRQDVEDRFPGLNLHILDKPFRYQQLIESIDKVLTQS